MIEERDFDANPYSADEKRVVDYLTKIVPDIGAGDDPIGFLIACHAQLSHEARKGRKPTPEEIDAIMRKVLSDSVKPLPWHVPRNDKS